MEPALRGNSKFCFLVVRMALPKCDCIGNGVVFVFFYKVVLYNVLK